jgi:hypothetical protein
LLASAASEWTAIKPEGFHLTSKAEDFTQALRTGVSPHDHELDPEFMPWDSIAKHSDDELKAIWLYLSSLPALESATR